MPYKCKKKARAAIKDWEERNPEKMREARRKYKLEKRYGITIEQFDALSKSQKHRCAVCRKKKKLVVDHCHRRGNTRGLLCNMCNIALGHVGDSPRILRKLADYLQSNRKCRK